MNLCTLGLRLVLRRLALGWNNILDRNRFKDRLLEAFAYNEVKGKLLGDEDRRQVLRRIDKEERARRAAPPVINAVTLEFASGE